MPNCPGKRLGPDIDAFRHVARGRRQAAREIIEIINDYAKNPWKLPREKPQDIQEFAAVLYDKIAAKFRLREEE